MRLLLALTIGALILPASAQTGAYQVRHSFSGADGGGPNCIIQATNGFFYGTASNGGLNVSGLSDGGGTVFRMDSTGKVVTLHAFNATDGYNPAGIIQASDGNFYGATSAGGQPSGGGGGTIFKMTAAGTLTTLHAFVGGFGGTDGGGPSGPPILANDGFLYGLTAAGGAFRDIDHQGGFGTAYKINPTTGATTIIHSFNIADPNGIFPSGRLVQATDGNFYGTTREGALGGGSVFRITSAGVVTLIHALTESGEPLDGVIQAIDGRLYGTTDGGQGTVFRLALDGSGYAVLNRFDGADGYRPHSALVEASTGSFYGVTPQGGLLDFQGGDIFLIGSGGTLIVRHSFSQAKLADGIAPSSRLIKGADGALYGAAGVQGAGGHGVIFRFDLSLPRTVAAVSVPSKLSSGDTGTGTVTLASPAPTGGVVVFIGSGSFQLTVPSSITIPAGATSGTFALHVGSITVSEVIRIYASVAGQGVRTTTTAVPLPKLIGLSFSPTSVAGGGTSTGTVTLGAPAPSAGAVVTLTSNSTKASVPSTVKVAGGATSVSFVVRTSRVKSNTGVTISATYNGQTLRAVLTVLR